MIRKILGFLAVLAIIIAAAWNVNFGSKTNGMSDVILANVDALAQGEVLTGKECRFRGSSVYDSYIPCTANYPNIGQCVSAENAFYSSDTGQCYE
jgi:hypothetical protein